MVDILRQAAEIAEVLGAATVRRRTDDLSEMGHTLMSHLEAKGTRAVIAAPTMALARDIFEQVAKGWPLRFENVENHPNVQWKAKVKGGGELLAMSLDRPRNWMGPQFSFAVVVLTPQLADLFDSLDNLNHALRIGDNPKQIQYVNR